MLFRVLSIAGALSLSSFALASSAWAVDDFDRAYNVGEGMKRQGFFTEYSVSGWGPSFEATISSLLPGEARQVAQSICESFRTNMQKSWEVRVFLANSGSRPAATCQSK